MLKWILLALLALLVLLAWTVRLGVLAGYGRDGPWVQLRVGPKTVPVYPVQRSPKKEKPPKKPRKKRPAGEPAQRDKGGLLELAWDLLPVVGKAAGRFRRKLRIDELTLHLTWAEEDPADAGIHYGWAWGLTENLLAFLEARFTIQKREVSLDVDFLAEEPRLLVRAGLSITPAQLLAVALPAGGKALKVLWEHRKTRNAPAGAAQQQKGEDDHGKQASCQ